MSKISDVNLMRREKLFPGYTEKLEYELAKRFDNHKGQKPKFTEIYAEAEKATKEYFQKKLLEQQKEAQKKKQKRKPKKKEITTSAFVVVYRKIDPDQVKNFPKIAYDNQGNTFGQISSRHYNFKSDIKNYEGRTYRTQPNRWNTLLKKLKTNQDFADDWDKLTQSTLDAI